MSETTGWAEITRVTLINSRRRMADSLEKKAALGGDLRSPEALRLEAAICRAEAYCLERDGKLPDGYLDTFHDV